MFSESQSGLVALTLFAAVVWATPESTYGQSSGFTVKGSLGMMRNLHSGSQDYKFTAYPEIEVSVPVQANAADTSGLFVGIFLGGWDEPLPDLSGLPDNCFGCGALVRQSDRAVVTGIRLGSNRRTGSNQGVRVAVGISRTIVTSTLTRAVTRSGGTASSRIYSFYNVEIGAGLDGSVGKGVLLGVGVTLLWEVFGSDLDVDPRMALALRVSHRK